MLRNFGYLSAIQILGPTVQFMTYPYLIRVLSPELFGHVVFANGVAAFLLILSSFGFNNTGVRAVAALDGDLKRIGREFSCRLTLQLSIWLVTLSIVFIFFVIFPSMGFDKYIFILAHFASLYSIMVPRWLYEGVGRLSTYVKAQLLVQVLNAGILFTVVREPSDYWLVPASLAFSGVLVGIPMLMLVWRRTASPHIPSISDSRKILAESHAMFLSNITAAVTDKAGVVLLGVFVGGASLTFYHLAERLTVIASAFVTNLSRANLPRLAASRSAESSRRNTAIQAPVGALGAATLWLLATPICELVGGEAMIAGATALRAMAPYVLVSSVGAAAANIIIVNRLDKALLGNTLLSAVFYLAAVTLLGAMDAITSHSMAIAFVLGSVVRVGHRCLMLRRRGFIHWLL